MPQDPNIFRYLSLTLKKKKISDLYIHMKKHQQIDTKIKKIENKKSLSINKKRFVLC